MGTLDWIECNISGVKRSYTVGWHIKSYIIYQDIGCPEKFPSFLTAEQKGLRIGSRGCKEQLIIDTLVVGQTNRGQRNMFYRLSQSF